QAQVRAFDVNFANQQTAIIEHIFYFALLVEVGAALGKFFNIELAGGLYSSVAAVQFGFRRGNLRFQQFQNTLNTSVDFLVEERTLFIHPTQFRMAGTIIVGKRSEMLVSRIQFIDELR